MIHLDDDNDPMLFSVVLPNGTLILQYMEVLVALQAVVNSSEPTHAQIAHAIRSACRSTTVAADASDAHLIAAWHRIGVAVMSAGKG